MLKGMGFCGWGGGKEIKGGGGGGGGEGGEVSCGAVEAGDRGDSEPGKRVMMAYSRGSVVEDRYCLNGG